MRTFAIAASVAAGLAGFAIAQNVGPLPPLTAQVEVHVVNVDATVTDTDGNPVVDLTKDDFEIFEDGVPQKVTNFSIFRTAGTPPPAVAAEGRSASMQRRILLIIDNNYLGIVERNQALDIVEKYLNDSFSGEWAVAAIGRHMEMLQSFTSDKALIRGALGKARKMPSSEIHHQIDRSVLSERFIKKEDFMVPVDYREKVAFSGREQTFRNLLTIQNTARAVVDTARAYAAEDGKKFIVLVTGGIESNTSFAAYEKKHDFEMKELRDEIAKITDAMVREANGANFTVHVINGRSRGMAAPQHDVSNHSSGITAGSLLRNFVNDPIDVADVDTIPLSIALGTGGMYLPSSDVRGSLQQIDTLTSNFYSLGYSPAHDGDRQYHRIKVVVKRPGVRVANRAGYFDETPEDRLQEMLKVRMTFDRGFGSLPVKVALGHVSQTDRGLVLPVMTAMPLARITVVPHDESFVGRVHVYCSVFDENGRNVGFHHQTQEVTLAPQELSGPGDFRYTMKVHLQKGAFTIVITLRDELSNEIGSASEAISL
ncbi:MAG TPA: VWA domain-containing protein [Thermoanaerobaculia bacterium]|nr:VWA domain-containing protein [Thermoanaerobaculia bacterium]